MQTHHRSRRGAAVAGLHPAHAVDLTVHGQPPLGLFGMETVEQVEACSKLGMTLVFTYEGDRHQLDVNDPLGKAIADNKMQVMFDVCRRFATVRLAKTVAPGDDVPPVGIG